MGLVRWAADAVRGLRRSNRQAPLPTQVNAEWSEKCIVTPIPFLTAEGEPIVNPSIVELLEKRMNDVARQQSEMLSRQLWPMPPLWRRALYWLSRGLCLLGLHDLVTEKREWSEWEDEPPALWYVTTYCRRYCGVKWDSEPFEDES